MVMLGLRPGIAWMVTCYRTPSRARGIRYSSLHELFLGSDREGEGGLAKLAKE